MKNQHCENCGVHKDMHAGVGCKTFVQPKESKTAEELFHAAFSGLRIQRSNEYKLGAFGFLWATAELSVLAGGSRFRGRRDAAEQRPNVDVRSAVWALHSATSQVVQPS